MHKVAYVLIIYTFLLAIIYPYIAHTDLPKATVVSLIAVVGLGKFFEYFLGIPYRILLQADQKNYIEYCVMIVVCVVYTMLSALMILRGESLVNVKLMSALITLIGLLFICGYAQKSYQLIHNGAYETINLTQRKHVAIHSVANIVHQNSDLVILTLFSDIKMVSVYSVYYYVIGQIKKLMSSFTNGLEAAFGNMWAKGEIEQMKKRFQLCEFFIYVVVLVVFSCVWSLILPFISLYTEKVNDVEYIRPVLAALITVTELVFCIREPYVIIIQAAGKYKETKKIAVFEAVANVTISLILTFKFGIYGVIVGTLLANLIRTGFYMWYSSREILSRKILENIKRTTWFVATFISCVFVERLILNVFKIDSWMMWIIAGCIMLFISVIITLISSFLFERAMVKECLTLIKR